MALFQKFSGFDPASLGLSLLGGIGSMLGGGGGLNRDQRQLLNTQKNVANNLYQYGTGVPGSDPGERAALAQQHALLGEQQLQQQNNAYGALQRNQGVGGLADFLQNMSSQRVAQNMALDSTHLMNALAQRKQALLSAANVSQGAVGLASQTGGQNPLPALFGQLGQALAYRQAYGQRPGAGGGAGMAGAAGNAGKANADTGLPDWAGAVGMQGAAAPGNEPGGINGVANQFRQGMGWVTPPGGGSLPGQGSPVGGSWLPAFAQPNGVVQGAYGPTAPTQPGYGPAIPGLRLPNGVQF